MLEAGDQMPPESLIKDAIFFDLGVILHFDDPKVLRKSVHNCGPHEQNLVANSPDESWQVFFIRSDWLPFVADGLLDVECSQHRYSGDE